MGISFWIPGCVAGLVAFVVFALTLERGVFPGLAAKLMAQALGAAEPTHLDNPVWSVLTELLARVSFLPRITALNLFSAVCGALAVMALFRVTALFLVNTWLGASGHSEMEDMAFMEDDDENVARAPHREMSLTEEQRLLARGKWLACAGGATAAAALAFSLPFWLASTHLHIVAFDALLLALMFLNLYRDYLFSRTFNVFAAALLAGVSLLESPFFLVLSPLAVAVLLLSQIQKKEKIETTVITLFISFLAGAGLALGAAQMMSQAHGLTLGGVLLANIPMSLASLFNGMPTMEGLWVAALMLVPVFFVWRAAYSGLHELNTVNFVSHFMLTLLVLYTFSNIQWSPWRIAARSDVLLGIPMLFAAFSTGYFFCFWVNICLAAVTLKKQKKSGDDDDILDELAKQYHELTHRWIPGVGAPLMAAVILAGVAVMLFLNLRTVLFFKKDFADRAAGHMLAAVQDESWVFSTTPLADNLMIQGWRDGKKLRVLDLDPDAPTQTVPPNFIREYLERTAEDPALEPALPGLKLAAENTLPVMLSRLIQAIPDTTHRVAAIGTSTPLSLTFPDATIVPHGFVYTYAAPDMFDNDDDGRAALDETKRFIELARTYLKAADDTPLTSSIRAALRGQVAHSLNMSGLLLEKAGLVDDAFATYGEVFAFSPANPVAIINRHLLAERHPGLDPESRARIDFDDHIRFARAIPPTPANLLETGQISSIPGYLAALEPRFARTYARQALALFDAYRSAEPAFTTLFARLIRTAFFFEPISESHDTPLDHITEALCAGDFATAATAFNALPADTRKTLPLYSAALDMALDQPSSGLDTLFYRVLDENPRSRTAWLLFLAYCIHSNASADIYAKIVLPLRQQGTSESAATLDLVIIFQRFHDGRNLADITASLHTVLKTFDDVTPLQELLLSQHLVEAARQSTSSLTNIAATADIILHQDPAHPIALYMSAAVALDTNDFPRAETLFRQSSEHWPAIPPAAALAFLLRHTGQLDAAVNLSRELQASVPSDAFVQLVLISALVERATGDDIATAAALMDHLAYEKRDPLYFLTRIRLRQQQRRFFEARKEIDAINLATIPFTDADLHRLAEFTRLNQSEILRAPLEESASERKPRRPVRNDTPGR